MKKLFAFLSVLIVAAFTPSTALAADILGKVTFPTELTSLNAGSFLNKLVGIFIAIAGLLFFFLLLWGGIRYMLAGGDPKNAESARKVITSAIIGLIIVITAYAVTSLLGKILGIPFLNPDIPGL